MNRDLRLSISVYLHGLWWHDEIFYCIMFIVSFFTKEEWGIGGMKKEPGTSYRRGLLSFWMILCAVACVSVTMVAYAAEKQVERKTVRMAFPVQNGMSEVGESGDLFGYNYLYLQTLAEYAGWNLEFITYENMSVNDGIMQAMEDVKNGDADLLGPILKSEAVEEMFDFPQHNYGVVYTTLSAFENSNLTSVNYAYQDPLRVAVYRTGASRREEVKTYLDQLGVNYQLIDCDSTEEQMNLLERGEADVLSSISLSYFEGTRAVTRFSPRPYYLVTTKGNTALVQELDQAVEKLNYTQPMLQEQLQQQFFGNTSGGYILTEDEKQYLSGINAIDVLCISNFAPYCLRLKDGEPYGLLVSLLKDFAKDNNLEIRFQFCDDASALESYWDTGKYDCVIGLPFTPAYCVKYGMIRSSSVITTNMEIFGETRNKDYGDSTVAVYGEFTDHMKLDAFKEIISFPSLDECFKAVVSGRADYGCTNQLSADYQIFAHAYPFVTTPLLGEQLGIGVAVDAEADSRLLSVLNKYIDSLPDNTVTAYLSEASRHEDIDSFALLIRKQPLLVAAILSVAVVMVALLGMLLFISNKQKKWNDRLQKANEAMQNATNAKSEFLSRMSHDIRTPLNAILGFAKLGQDDLRSPELVRGDLDKISTSGEFLLGLVNDILDMTKIENNAMELRPQPYIIHDFENQLRTLVEPMCQKKKITFTIRLAEDMPECILVDKIRFNQVFFNLLSNAVKFTPEGGKVEVTGTCLDRNQEQAHMIFKVRDNGIGMSEEFQKKMFDSFSQEEQHISTEQGTGLGLAIVKSFVELMNGSIRVESKLGEGSCFVLEMNEKICEAPSSHPIMEKSGHEGVLAGKKLLLCEDHPMNTKLACRVLENVGMIVTCAENGQIGLDTFAASKPGEFDLILMDIQMPVMNGIEATRAIRSLGRPDAGTIPIIAMTANAFADDVKICMDAGMNAHLAKPFVPEKLYVTLAKFLQ